MAPRCIFGLLLLCLSTLVAQGHVHTNRANAKVLPLTKEEGVWHFVVYGDRTGGPREGVKVLAQAVEDTNLLDPDLVMTVGDMIQGYTGNAQWMKEMREFQGIMNRLRRPWFPVAGNHDTYWRGEGRPFSEHDANYEKHFGPLWYWFAHKNAAFVVLYTDEGDPETGRKNFSRGPATKMTPAQLEWLEGALVETKKYEHVFVFVHHPRWLKDRYPDANWDEVHARLVKAGNVTGVFAGHIHRMVYDGVKDGIEYFALATTGGGLRTELPQAGWLHHFNVVTVRQGGISLATIPVGAAIDPRKITSGMVDRVESLMRDFAPVAKERLALSPAGDAAGTLRLEMKNPTDKAIEVALRLESPDPNWVFTPDHRHVQLAAGGFAVTTFRALRKAAGFEKPFASPEVVHQVDYLGEAARISLPEQRRALALTLDQLAPDLTLEDHVLELRGKGDCVRVDAALIPLPDGPFTLEGWVNPAKLTRRAPFVAKTENSEYSIFINEGKPSFSVHLDGRYHTAGAPEPLVEVGKWTHIAGVFDGKEVRLYVDGRRVARVAAEGKRRTNRLPLYIGADPNGRGRPVNPLAGRIDRVRLSRGAIYEGAEIPRPWYRILPEPVPDTLLELRFDQQIGPFHVDTSPAGAHGMAVRNARIRPRDGQ